MTHIGGTKPVYAPITTAVDNNAKPSSGSANGGTSPGLLQPGPNTQWIETVAGKPVVKTAWQRAEVSQEAKDKRAAAEAAGTAITIGTRQAQPTSAAQTMQPTMSATTTSQEATGGGQATFSGLTEDLRESSNKSLETEAKHDEQVAQSKAETLAKMRAEDLLKEKAQELKISQGAAPAA
jgi:hypothetical protein